MRQTLFVIPHEWLDGWPLIIWLVISAVAMIYLVSKHGFSGDTLGFVPIFLIVAAGLHFAVPQIEVNGINPDDPSGSPIPIGLAIRGYGVFLLMGMLFGVGFIIYRAQSVGINSDQILTLAFWMIVLGIIGARVFYVVQKWETLGNAPPRQFLINLVDMTKGGLVVYGSLFGGMIAAMLFFWKTKLSVGKMADLIAPGMVLGLAIGRVGCLMNGCCYGGVCNPDLPSLKFPAGSPAYMRQVAEGELWGLKTDRVYEDGKETAFQDVTEVALGSQAEAKGLRVADRVYIQPPEAMKVKGQLIDGLDLKQQIYVEASRGNEPIRKFEIPISNLSKRSLQVHPTQVYSSINAALLFLVLWFYWPFRKSDGEVFAMMLILYAIARFLLELIRTDELGLFGSPFTISQWVSFGGLAIGLAMLVWARKRNPLISIGKGAFE